MSSFVRLPYSRSPLRELTYSFAAVSSNYSIHKLLCACNYIVMNYLSHARAYISFGLLKRYSYVSSTHIPWNQCFCMPSKSRLKPAGVCRLGISSVHRYSSRSKASKLKMSTAIPVADKEKGAFFVVRKCDVIGIYKDLSDCQAQVGSSVLDSAVSVYKGYSLPKAVEEYLSSVGLKKPLYSIRASDLKDDMFGSLTPCLFQDPESCIKKLSKDEATSDTKSKDDQFYSASLSVDVEPSADTSEETCFIEFDGASRGNPGLSGAAAVCKLRQGLGIATNNAAEYNALILGLKYAIEKGYEKIKVKGDSKLVCMQIKGQWKVNHEGLAKLHKEAKELCNKCVSFEISHVLRKENADADEQANLAVRLSEGEVEVA